MLLELFLELSWLQARSPKVAFILSALVVLVLLVFFPPADAFPARELLAALAQS
jgi:hypothetical protein